MDLIQTSEAVLFRAVRQLRSIQKKPIAIDRSRKGLSCGTRLNSGRL
jgi:hypothetical protein